MAKGKLIVLEGIDGSGKSAQYRRLCARMEKDKIAYTHIVFPRYDRDSSALIRLYLGGAFASYRDDWGKTYESGGLILSDRYTTSNAVHQGSKLPDSELPAFFSWLADLEYDKMGLPRPDLVLYLDVDLETSCRRMRRREEKNHTSADIHELDNTYLARCLHTADMACEHYGWTRVPFLKDGRERDVDEKNDEIYGIILQTLGN